MPAIRSMCCRDISRSSGSGEAPRVMHPAVGALLIAVAKGTPPRCDQLRAHPVSVARVALVDGMPFVTALRPTIGLRFHPEAATKTPGYTVYDGTRPIAWFAVRSDGLEIHGVARRNPGGFVEVQELPPQCVRSGVSPVLLPAVPSTGRMNGDAPVP